MTTARRQDVCVVIPGHNSARTLRQCLESLLPLLDSGQIAKIVFVDDHSDDDTPLLAEAYPVQVLSSPRRGAGAARNVGWLATDTEYIWFVDSDCVAHPDALKRLKASMVELGASVVGGSYSNQNAGSLVSDLIHEEMVGRHRAMGRRVTFAITANLLCRRDTLTELGGFDESLRLGQDLDFAYRVVESGRLLGFDAKSLVGHFHETKLLHYLRKQARQGFWRMHLYRRHPKRMSGDTYSGLVDYVQPPLAVAAITAPAIGLALGVPVIGGAASLMASVVLLSCQLGHARALVASTGDARYWCYVPFGMARAAFRGAGMVAGVVAATLNERLRQRANKAQRVNVLSI